MLSSSAARTAHHHIAKSQTAGEHCSQAECQREVVQRSNEGCQEHFGHATTSGIPALPTSCVVSNEACTKEPYGVAHAALGEPGLFTSLSAGSCALRESFSCFRVPLGSCSRLGIRRASGSGSWGGGGEEEWVRTGLPSSRPWRGWRIRHGRSAVKARRRHQRRQTVGRFTLAGIRPSSTTPRGVARGCRRHGRRFIAGRPRRARSSHPPR